MNVLGRLSAVAVGFTLLAGTALAHVTDDALVNADGCHSIPAGSPPHTCHPDPEPTETIVTTVTKSKGKAGWGPTVVVLGLVVGLAVLSETDWVPQDDEKSAFGQDLDEPPLRFLPMLDLHGEFGVKTQYELDRHHRLELQATAPMTDRDTGSVVLRFKMDLQQ